MEMKRLTDRTNRQTEERSFHKSLSNKGTLLYRYNLESESLFNNKERNFAEDKFIFHILIYYE